MLSNGSGGVLLLIIGAGSGSSSPEPDPAAMSRGEEDRDAVGWPKKGESRREEGKPAAVAILT